MIVNRKRDLHVGGCLCHISYRIEETYVKVGKSWKYLYRAVDSAGQTIECMLSARRDVSAAALLYER
jgi:transposase-like protein